MKDKQKEFMSKINLSITKFATRARMDELTIDKIKMDFEGIPDEIRDMKINNLFKIN
jgi:hypothetical protein